MIGADRKAIKKAEDRKLFKQAMLKIGLDLPKSGLARDIKEAKKIAAKIGFPLIIRPSFTLGGTGAGTVYIAEEFEFMARRGLESSMISEILIEESIIGWKEYELEVMRDRKDNVVIICSIENFDPMGSAYRRFYHRGPGPDSERPGIPEDARRGQLPVSGKSGWKPVVQISSSRSIRIMAGWW